MSITQRQLADMFQVSQMTISRALRGHEGVNKKLRDSIVAAAQEQGYSQETNCEARLLRSRATGQKIASNIFCAMIWEPGDEQSFHGRLLRGLYDGATELGNELVVAHRYGNKMPLLVTRRQTDGVIRLLTETDFDDGLVPCPLPWVSILFDVPDADVVTIDNRQAMYEVGKHLCALGHRKVAYLGGTGVLSTQRLTGLRAAVTEAGGQVPDRFVEVSPWAGGEQSTFPMVDALLEGITRKNLAEHFTALVCYNDYIAMVVMRRLQQRGIRVPQDLSIAGFDGAVPKYFMGPQLTTVAQPLEDLGMEAARLLSWRLQVPTAARRRTVLDTKLVPGETVIPVPNQ